MKIEWVNHASFVLETDAIRLICDPWLEGTAFDNGWKLLAETQFSYDDFKTITHIWFSHEHPDHFSPPNLKRIPPEFRKSITVLYQYTKDKKVVEFCRDLGFGSAQEMVPQEWITLGQDCRIMVTPFSGGDSWMALQAEGKTFLNLNDCVVHQAAEMQAIRKIVGSIDVLFTQFSYANWVGNKEDVAGRRAHAEEKLRRVSLQIQVLQPHFVVPFASYVWFCHSENFYMNDTINRIGEVHQLIEEQTSALPIVLYPGDAWDLSPQYRSQDALSRYLQDYESLSTREVIYSESVELDKLIEQSRDFMQRLKSTNSTFFLAALLRPTHIYLTDHQTSVLLSFPEGLNKASIGYDRCDVAISSQALLYCLRFLWGGNTLAVNGRFQKPLYGRRRRFEQYFVIAHLNNRGEQVRWLFVTQRIWAIVRRKLHAFLSPKKSVVSVK